MNDRYNALILYRSINQSRWLTSTTARTHGHSLLSLASALTWCTRPPLPSSRQSSQAVCLSVAQTKKSWHAWQAHTSHQPGGLKIIHPTNSQPASHPSILLGPHLPPTTHSLTRGRSLARLHSLTRGRMNNRRLGLDCTKGRWSVKQCVCIY